MKTKKSNKSNNNVGSTFAYQAVQTLLEWARQNKQRGVFVVICDKQKTNVAFCNLNKMMLDGSVTIGNDPDLYAAWETLGLGVDFCADENAKDPEWLKAVNDLPVDAETWRWKGFDYKKEHSFSFSRMEDK